MMDISDLEKDPSEADIRLAKAGAFLAMTNFEIHISNARTFARIAYAKHGHAVLEAGCYDLIANMLGLEDIESPFGDCTSEAALKEYMAEVKEAPSYMNPGELSTPPNIHTDHLTMEVLEIVFVKTSTKGKVVPPTFAPLLRNIAVRIDARQKYEMKPTLSQRIEGLLSWVFS